MQRPTVLTVLGILGIIYGAITLLSTPISLLVLSQGGEAVAALPAWQLADITVATLLTGMVAVAMVIAAIGLLQMAPWSRGLAIAVAGYQIVMQLIGAVILVITLPAMVASMQVPTDDPFGSSVMTGAMIGGAVGGMAGVVFWLVANGAVIYLLTRPDIVKACRVGRRPETPLYPA
jgi:hypothetical protein